MKYCPITYEEISEHQNYSATGLRRLSPRLKDLLDLPYSAEEQLRESAARAGRMSVQGVQPKLSAVLDVKEQSFRLVDTGGRFILKPQNPSYANLPENEDLVMRLAEAAGIEVPMHGLARSKDGSFTYFVKRFDRSGRKEKIAVEDFAQLSGATRDTKYNSSMERVAGIIDTYCGFPIPQKAELLRRTLFSFLAGNEDMHLKNFSLIRDGRVLRLSPAYDLVSSSIVLNDPDELALPLRGKKRRLDRSDLIGYFGRERLGLRSEVVESIAAEVIAGRSAWDGLIERSFLPDDQKERLTSLLTERSERLL